jgi:hypothetical protein
MKITLQISKKITLPDLTITCPKDLSSRSIQKLLQEVKQEIQPFFPHHTIEIRKQYDSPYPAVCQYCKEVFSSFRALRSHQGQNPICHKARDRDRPFLYVTARWVRQDTARYFYVSLEGKDLDPASQKLFGFKFRNQKLEKIL